MAFSETGKLLQKRGKELPSGPKEDQRTLYAAAVAASLKQALPQQYDCISSRGLGNSQRAMIYYFANIKTWREENPRQERECSFLLLQGTVATAELPAGKWQRIWESSRPRDKVERYRLYERVH